MNLFDVIPQNFFNMLTSSNKNIYFDCLKRIYDMSNTEQSFSLDKSIVVDDLKTYFKTISLEKEDDVQFEDNPQSKAYSVLRKMKDYGWIDEDFVGSTLKISLPDYSQTVLETLIKIMHEEESEYKTSIHNIYSIIINRANFNEPYSLIIKNVNDIMMDLIKSLKKLNTNIKKHVDRIINQKTPKEVIETIESFYDEIISKSYDRVKRDGNIAKYKVKVIEAINSILGENELKKAIDDCLNKDQNIKTKEEAENKVKDLIYQITLSFESYDAIMLSVDERYNKFLKNASERAHFLMSTDTSLVGKINILIKNLLEISTYEDETLMDDDGFMDKILKIYTQDNLTNDSLYVARNKIKDLEVEDISVIKQFSEEEKNALIEKEKEKNEYFFSLNNVNNFISNNLSLNEIKRMSEIGFIGEKYNIIPLYIYLYSDNAGAIYKTTVLNKKIVYGNLMFRDFEIVRIK